MQADALSQAVHTLKSSTANLGGTRLAMVARECEVLVREGGIIASRAAGAADPPGISRFLRRADAANGRRDAAYAAIRME